MERAKNIFDKIGSLIPGYRGYAEREGRRQCDKILRDNIASMMTICEKSIKAKLTHEIKQKKYDSINIWEECRKQMDTLVSKIKYAPYGESAFSSSSQIKEEELLEIYRKDLEIIEIATNLKETVKDMSTDTILAEIDRINKLLNLRNQYIKEYK